MNKDNLLTQPQAADLIGVNPRTIERWIWKFNLPVVKIAGVTFIDRQTLLAFQPPKPGRRPKVKK